MQLRNLPVAYRIGACFVAFALLLVFLQVYAFWRTTQIHDQLSEAFTVRAQTQTLLATLRGNLHGSEAEQLSRGSAFEAEHARLKTLPGAPSASVQMDEMLAAHAAYLQRLRQPAAESQAGASSEALRSRLSESINRVAERMDQWAQNAAAGASDTHHRARIEMLIVAVIYVSLASYYAWMTTIGVSRPIRRAVSIANEMATGDLTTEIVVRRQDESGQLFSALNAMQTSLRTIAGRIRESAHAIAAASGDLAHGNANLARRTDAQGATLQQTAASMGAFLASVQSNAQSAARAAESTTRASSLGKTGGEQVRELKVAMQQVSGSAGRIQEITGVINAIAFQTNILALNAAVEAARAGDQGRGFSVVAQEVRVLAQRCGEAAKQIDTLVADSSTNVRASVGKVDAVVTTLEALLEGVQQSTDAVGQIAQATREQRGGVEKVGEDVAQLNRVTQQNATLVEEAANGAKRLDDLAQVLLDAVQQFKLSTR